MLYDIIIPHTNIPGSDRLAYECVSSIQRHSKDFRIIWIQNGGEIPPAVSKLFSKLSGLSVEYNVENVGFLKAANQGLKVATAEYVVLLNNDTEAVSGWLDKLREPLKWPVVLSGPRTTTEQSWQGKAPAGVGAKILGTHAMLAFFCVMMDRRVLSAVGLLDEDFGVGFGDDDNYCARVHAAGLRIALVQDLVIPHKHRFTFNAIYGEKEVKAMQRTALNLHYKKMENMF